MNPLYLKASGVYKGFINNKPIFVILLKTPQMKNFWNSYLLRSDRRNCTKFASTPILFPLCVYCWGRQESVGQRFSPAADEDFLPLADFRRVARFCKLDHSFLNSGELFLRRVLCFFKAMVYGFFDLVIYFPATASGQNVMTQGLSRNKLQKKWHQNFPICHIFLTIFSLHFYFGAPVKWKYSTIFQYFWKRWNTWVVLIG